MNIILDYQPDVASAPAGFEADLANAVEVLDAAITNPITVTIQISYEPLDAGTLADSNPTFAGFEPTYTQLVGYLTAAANADPTAANQSVLANLTTDPTAGGTYLISNAQEKAWGLLPAASSEEDGFVNFSNAVNWSATGAPGTYDLVGLAEAELTHALGRVVYNGTATAMNLVSYGEATGTLDLNASDNRYFSVDGGKTNLAWFGNASTDPADFSDTGDPLNWSLNPGQAYSWSSLDSEMMSVLGFSVAGAAAPSPPAPPTPATPPEPPPATSPLDSPTIYASTPGAANSYSDSNATAGDTFILDGTNSSLTIGLSSSTDWAFGYNEVVGIQGGAATVTDWGQDMHLIVSGGATVTAIAIAGATAHDAGWTVTEIGVTAAQLSDSARSDGTGGTIVGTGGTTVDLKYLQASTAGHLFSG
jgi:hypothetical protein